MEGGSLIKQGLNFDSAVVIGKTQLMNFFANAFRIFHLGFDFAALAFKQSFDFSLLFFGQVYSL